MTVATCAGAHYQGVGISHIRRLDVGTTNILHVGLYSVERFTYIWYLIVNNYLHFSRKSTQKYLKNAPL